MSPPHGSDRLWDLVVLGGGTAGIVASRTAAALGASVVLVESARTGGDCLWTGCVPSKALLAAASGRVGPAVEQDDRFRAAMAHVQSSIAAVEPDDSPQTLEEHGVRVVPGRGSLTARVDVVVDDREVLRTRQVILATGSTPAMPPIDGLAAADPWTSESIWSLDALPPRLTILGGGSVGCELGQAFARLGSTVTLVEQQGTILPGEDPDAAAVVTDALARDGVRVVTGGSVASTHGDRDGGSVRLGDGETHEHDALLVATGRRPRTRDLGLEDAGVGVDLAGHVMVDEQLRTTNPRVWAAGDLTGHPQLTHVAGVHASVAASNAVLGLRRKAERTVVPRVVFTDPEVASAGVPTPARNSGVRTLTMPHTEVDRAVTEDATGGFSRLAVDGSGRIVGATVVGPRAGESIAELVLAMRQGLRTRDLVGSMHAYPTFADGVWNLAIADFQTSLGSGRTRQVIGLLGRARRTWLDRTAAL